MQGKWIEMEGHVQVLSKQMGQSQARQAAINRKCVIE